MTLGSRFCRERKDEAPICVELGIGLFVDDRLDVLETMVGVPVPEAIVPVPTWAAAEAAILAVLDRGGLARSA